MLIRTHVAQIDVAVLARGVDDTIAAGRRPQCVTAAATNPLLGTPADVGRGVTGSQMPRVRG